MKGKRRIVHLDDHKIFLTGAQMHIQRHVEGVFYSRFHDPESTLRYIYNCLEAYQKIDLIITDFTQKSNNGYHFAKEVRRMEAPYGFKIPIMLWSLCRSTNPEIVQGLKEETFNVFLPKDCEINEVIRSVHDLMNISY